MTLIAYLLRNWVAVAVAWALGAAAGAGGVWWLRDQMAAQAQLSAAHAETRAARTVTHTVVRQGETSERVVTRYIEGAERVRTVTRNIVHDVPNLVPVEVDRAYGPLPVGFVRVWNAAVGGVPTVPDAAGRADAAPSGIDPSAVAANAAENFGIAHENAEQLIGLQDWVRAQAAISRETPRP